MAISSINSAAVDEMGFFVQKSELRRRRYVDKKASLSSSSSDDAVQLKPKKKSKPRHCPSMKIQQQYKSIVEDIMKDKIFFKKMHSFKFKSTQLKDITRHCILSNEFFQFVEENFDTDEKHFHENKKEFVFKYCMTEWQNTMTKFYQLYCLTPISKIKLIVIGSLGYKPFRLMSMVSERKNVSSTEINVSVKRFRKKLDKAYENEKSSQIDYHAEWARENGCFFINTCLTENYDDIINWYCTTEFVNRLIEKRCELNRDLLTVLDLRLPEYINRSEYNSKIEQDEEFYICVNEFPNTDVEDNITIFPLLKRDNVDYIRIGCPFDWKEDNEEEIQYLKEKFAQLLDNEVPYIYKA